MTSLRLSLRTNKGSRRRLTFYDPIGYVSNRCADWNQCRRLQRDWCDSTGSMRLHRTSGEYSLASIMDCFSCHKWSRSCGQFSIFSWAGMKRTDFWKQAAFFGKMRNIGSTNNGQATIFYGGSSMFDDLAPGYNTAATMASSSLPRWAASRATVEPTNRLSS